MINVEEIKARLAKHKTEAAQFESPILLFHGSSSKYLQSILKHGLIPAAKEGRWVGLDPDASEHNRSRVSYGGVYFTTNLQTATSAASNLIIHQDGNWQDRKSNQIVVCAQIQPSSTIGDEDDYKGNLFNELHIPETMISSILAQLRAKILRKGGYDSARYNKETSDYVDKNVEYLLNKYAGSGYKQRNDLSRLYPLAQEVLLTELERQVAYRSVRNGAKPHYSFEYDSRKILDRLDRMRERKGESYGTPLPQAMRPQSKEKAEQRARQALDLFIKATKGYSKQNLEEQRDQKYTRGTARVMDAVSFSGRNKIICIVEFVPSKTEKYGDDLLVHYGTIPLEFKHQYIQFKGPWPKVFNKAGQQIQSSVYGFKGDTQSKSFVGPIAFDQKNGLGQVPNNENIKYAGFSCLMSIEKFLALAAPRDFNQTSSIEHITDHIKTGGALGSPFLMVDFSQNPPVVKNHEGRTRAAALKQIHGASTNILVHIFPVNGNRARHLSVDTINNFKQGAMPEKSDKFVKGPLFYEFNWLDTWYGKNNEQIEAAIDKESWTSAKIVYHGTARQFDKFDKAECNPSTPKYEISGYFFTSNKLTAWSHAERMAKKTGGKARLVGATLNLQNPINVTKVVKKYQKKLGNFGQAKNKAYTEVDQTKHDGILFDGDNVNNSEYVVFDPQKIQIIPNKTKVEASSNIRIQPKNLPETITEPFGGQTNTIYKFNVFKNGERLNCLLTIVVESSEPNKGYFIIDGEEKNNIGAAGMRQIFRAVHNKHPKLKQLYGTRVTGAKRLSGKMDRSVVYDLTKANDEEFDRSSRDGLLGKSLYEAGRRGPVVIYRACSLRSKTIGDNDYVTRSLRFAKEHAISNSIVNGEQYHVLQTIADPKHVFEAMNPGEYFYKGPVTRSKVVYITEEDENY